MGTPTRLAAIELYIRENPGCIFEDIQNAAPKLSNQVIARTIIRLVDDGHIKTVRGKYYYPNAR